MMGHSVAMFCETYADLLVEATHDVARLADDWLARQDAAGPSRASAKPAQRANGRHRHSG